MTGKSGRVIANFLLPVFISLGFSSCTVESFTGGSFAVFSYYPYADFQRLLLIFSIVAGLFLMLIIMLIVLFIKNTFTTEKYKNQMITLSAIYASMPDMMFAKDTNGLYTSCNDSFAEFARLPESEIIGKTPLEIFRIDEKMARSFMNADKKVLTERASVKVEEYFTFPDSSQRLYETIKAPLIRDGELIGMLGI